jgi:hypothetical protein
MAVNDEEAKKAAEKKLWEEKLKAAEKKAKEEERKYRVMCEYYTSECIFRDKMEDALYNYRNELKKIPNGDKIIAEWEAVINDSNDLIAAFEKNMGFTRKNNSLTKDGRQQPESYEYFKRRKGYHNYDEIAKAFLSCVTEDRLRKQFERLSGVVRSKEYYNRITKGIENAVNFNVSLNSAIAEPGQRLMRPPLLLGELLVKIPDPEHPGEKIPDPNDPMTKRREAIREISMETNQKVSAITKYLEEKYAQYKPKAIVMTKLAKKIKTPAMRALEEDKERFKKTMIEELTAAKGIDVSTYREEIKRLRELYKERFIKTPEDKKSADTIFLFGFFRALEEDALKEEARLLFGPSPQETPQEDTREMLIGFTSTKKGKSEFKPGAGKMPEAEKTETLTPDSKKKGKFNI